MSRYTAGKNAGAPMSRLDVVGERIGCTLPAKSVNSRGDLAKASHRVSFARLDAKRSDHEHYPPVWPDRGPQIAPGCLAANHPMTSPRRGNGV